MGSKKEYAFFKEKYNLMTGMKWGEQRPFSITVIVILKQAYTEYFSKPAVTICAPTGSIT